MTLVAHFSLSAQAASHRVIDPAAMGDDWGGGSRAGFLGLVRAMGRLGTYKIRAIGPFNERRQEIDGVEYWRLDQVHKLDHPDVHHAFYDGAPIIESKARMRIWGHHTYIPNGNALDWADLHTAPSRHSLDHLKRSWDPHGRWAVVPNAVEGLDGVEWAPVDGRVLYHTTPDRGLHVLSGMWPEIRARVPGATLHVVGDVREMAEAPVPARSVRGRRAAMLRENMAAAETAGGVTLLGRLTRAELLREVSEAACFAFPTSVAAPCETWSISVHECAAIGVPVVLCGVDSLPMWKDYAVVIPERIEQHGRPFVDAVVRLLTDADEAKRLSDVAKTVQQRWSFDGAAAVLDGEIRTFMRETYGL
jgi:glycosyltransferase involved in cell wall biosynthesis